MEKRGDGIAGGVLIVAALATVLAMTHHPSSAHASGMGRFVHGAMIAVVGATGYGFAHLALRRGLDRPAVLAGLIAYMIGVFGNIGAATINGFVVTALAARGADRSDLFLLAWESNQALAQLGVAATGIAFLLWSLGWVAQRGWAARGLGALGVAAGTAPIVLLAGGALRMNLAGAILVYGVHALWIALVGLYLWSGRFAKDASL